ncbi:MAG: ParB/RepB/Spo0J family partition protein [Candidatus Shapirobacteria bacterium]
MLAGAVIELETNLLQPNPLQPRGSINSDSISELVDSIREHGILEPLLVAKTPAGYQIIAGERRWQAAKMLGLDHVPVVVKEVDSRQMLKMALVENIQRKELNPLERGRALKRLRDEMGLTWANIAENIGKSVAYVVNSVRLLDLPDALKDGLLSGLITEGHARALGGIEDTRAMIEAYKTVLKEKASVRRAEEISRLTKEASRDEQGEELNHVLSKKEMNELTSKIKEGLSPLDVEVDFIHTRTRGSISLQLRGRIAQTRRFLESVAQKISFNS